MYVTVTSTQRTHTHTRSDMNGLDVALLPLDALDAALLRLLVTAMFEHFFSLSLVTEKFSE